MDNKLFDWLKQDLKNLEDKVDNRLQSIETKLDQVVAFRWQMAGGLVVISVLLNVFIGYIFNISKGG